MSKREIYESAIDPLVEAIGQICEAGGISFLCSFQIDDEVTTTCCIEPDYGPVDLSLGSAAHLLTGETDQMTLAAITLIHESAKKQNEGQGSADNCVRGPGGASPIAEAVSEG
jgi:hypothetical protein